MNNKSAKEKIGHFYVANKFKVIYAKDSSSALVSLHLFVKVGSAYETESEAGFSHFMEHLAFKSTINYPNNSLMDKASIFGSTLNAYTDYESTCFYLTIPSEYISEGLELLSEIAFKVNFSDNDFITEKGVIFEELKQIENDPEDSFIENIPNFLLNNSSYNRLIIGNSKSLSEAKSNDLREFYQKYYHIENMFLCISGDFIVDTLKKKVAEKFEVNQLITRSCPILVETPTIYPPDRISLYPPALHYPKDIKSNMLAFVLPEVSDNKPQSNALTVIGKAFAIGNKSRLYKRLYIQENLINSLKVHSISGKSDGLMIILIHPRKDADLLKIVSVFLEEIILIYRNGLAVDEIEQIKKELLISSEYVFEYMESLAQSLGNEEILNEYHTFFNYTNNIEKVSKYDIRNQLDEYYGLKKLHIIFTGEKPLDLSILPHPTSPNSPHFKTLSKNLTYRYQNYNTALTKDLNFDDRKYNDATTNKYTYSSRSSEHDIDHSQLIMPNGLKVLLKKTKEKSICGVSLALGVSQLDEQSNTLGLNHLTSSLLMYGNKKMDYTQCLEFCSDNGIYFTISNGKETTKLRFKCFKENLFSALIFLSNVLFHPVFPPEYIERLINTYNDNILRRNDYPQEEAIYRWKKMVFGKDSNLVSKEGSTRTLSNYTLKDIEGWYLNKILLSPATLCIVGDIEFTEIYEYIDKIFSRNIFNNNMRTRSIIVEPSTKKIIYHNKDISQSIISFGGFCMSGSDRRLTTAMSVLAQIVGGDICSRMFTLLREVFGIAYSADFDIDILQDIGYFQMYTIVDKKQEKQAVKILSDILNDIKKDGVTNSELAKTKSFLLGQHKLNDESVIAQAQFISTLLTIGYDYQFYLDRESRINNVTNEDIIEIAKKYFNEENLFIHILH